MTAIKEPMGSRQPMIVNGQGRQRRHRPLAAVLALVLACLAGLWAFAWKDAGPVHDYEDLTLVADPARMDEVLAEVAAAGGLVNAAAPQHGLAVVSVPAEAAEAMGGLPGVQAVAGSNAARAEPIRTGETPEPPQAEGGWQPQQVSQRQNLNLSAIKVSDLIQDAAVTGAGVRIAVIDTGVDMAHPAFAPEPDGTARVVHWADFTGRGSLAERAGGMPGTRPAEGDVALTGTAVASGDTLTVDQWSVPLGPVRSRTNRYRYGWLRLSGPMADALGGPVNLLVVAVDTQVDGVYDRILVAPGPEPDLRGVPALAPYPLSRETGLVALPGPEGREEESPVTVGVVLTELAPDGSYANLGFDGNGHGTHVAGLAAGAHEPWFQGAAPGAQVMVLKALSSRGEGSWSQIAAAVAQAVDLEADVITISITGLGSLAGDGQAEARYLRQAAARCGCLIVLAAGNDGPGLGTAATPGDDDYTLTVGAYTSPDLVAAYYGLSTAAEGVAYYSGVGPRPDGSLAPVVIAPGVAVGPVPFWHDPQGYAVMEGTSMAAPQTAGAAALLVEAARHEGIPPEPQRLRRAFERGARPIAGALLVEQGYGLVDAQAAWQELQAVALEPADLFHRISGEGDTGLLKGLYWRDRGPGSLMWTLRNTGREDRLWRVAATEPWILPRQQNVAIGAGSERSLSVTYRPPAGEGVHSGWLRIVNDRGDQAAAALHTIVNPVPALRSDGRGLERSGRLLPGERHRIFFRVEPGTRRLTMDLTHTGPPGSARLYAGLYDDAGRLRVEGVLAPEQDRDRWQQQLIVPGPGTWELVIHAASSLDAETAAGYDLRLSGARIHWQPEAWSINVGDGQASSRLLRLQAQGAGFTGRVMPMGYGTTPYRERSASIVVPAGDGVSYEIDVPEGSNFLEVAAFNLSPGAAPVDLYLFHLEPGSPLPVEVGHHRAAGNSPAVLQLLPPAPGRYVAWIEMAAAGEVELRYRIQTGRLSGLGAGVQNVRLGPGATRSILVHFQPRGDDEGHYGVVGILDETYGLWIGAVPVRVGGGAPSETVFTLRRAPGGNDELVLNVYDGWRPARGRVVIKGQTYDLQRGRTYLPASLLDEGRLQVELLDPAGRSQGVWTLTEGGVIP